MPDYEYRKFDESTSSGGPYYLEGRVIREDGRFFRVANTERIRGTEKRAALEVLFTVSAEDRAAASEWGWDPDSGQFRWLQIPTEETEVDEEQAASDEDDDDG